MRVRRRLFLPVLVLAIAACSTEPAPSGSRISGNENPLLAEWGTDFGVPPFDLIKNEDYLPAMREAMAIHSAAVVAIASDSVAPTFANTIEALERSGAPYSRVARVFGVVTGANTNDDIILNPELYQRVKAVYDQRDELDLNPEQLMLLEETHKGFVRSGAALDEGAKSRMREINKELAELSQKFSQNVLEETNAYDLYVSSAEDLGDLPQNLAELAESEAKRRGHDTEWSFTLQRPSINPFLESSTNRDLRRDIFIGYAMRGDNDNERDNKATLSRMAALRSERAHLLGYPTHAAYVLSDNMAETPDRVMALLDEVWRPALAVAKQERADMQALLPYFEVNAVRDGVFMVANKLYGLTFVERTDLPRWHSDQQVFEVLDSDGTHQGVLYLDFFARPSKQGGAWMNSLQDQSRLDGEKYPIVTTNFNFPAPTADGVSLITFDDALTLAHECGHAIHGLLSDVTYESLAGPPCHGTSWSSALRSWRTGWSSPRCSACTRSTIQTGEVIPDELVDKLQASSTFNQGFVTVEFVAAAYLDMAWHSLTEPVDNEARAFEATEMARVGLIPEITPRYRSTYFSHIFAGIYAAG